MLIFKKKDTCSIREDSVTSSCHDYESINSFDFGHRAAMKSKSCDSSDYAHIPHVCSIEEADSDSEPEQARPSRNKLLKIDSHGYASVLSPHHVDDSWEFDCLHQDRHRRDKDVLPSSSSSSSASSDKLRVRNVEEAWKHQQERGYASLTLKSYPPPLPPSLNRTSSDGLVSNPPSLSSHGASPQDYEVPIPRHPLPPPPLVANRKKGIPLIRQRAVFSPTTEHQTFSVFEREGDHAHFDSVSWYSDINKRIEKDGTVNSDFLSMHREISRRNHSASEVTGLTAHFYPLPSRSQ